jgi:ubiquinone/menaquinone biosynthesis C-methylase UbiE
MGVWSDRQYLLSEQYPNRSNLTVRIALHERFSVNRYGWHRWVFDHLRLGPRARVLELGCGPGTLWLENIARIPAEWEITLSDFSEGMLEDARRALEGKGAFRFEVIDAQELPYKAGSFDGVIANHMLYHVPDRPRALAEVRRVLRPGGRFFCATNGPRHLATLRELARGLVETMAAGFGLEPFNLENGAEQIAAHFEEVTVQRYEDALVVTEAQPLIDYLLSGKVSREVDERQRAVEAEIRRRIAEEGAIRIPKESGMFVGW